QTPVVEAHIVALDALGAGRDVRHERGDFLRRMRICDVNDAQSVRKPRNWNFGAADLLAELMQPSVVLLWRAVFLGHLKTGEGDWPCFIGDVDQPQKGRRRWAGEAHDIFIRHQHDPSPAQRKWQWQRGVRWPRERRAPVEA